MKRVFVAVAFLLLGSPLVHANSGDLFEADFTSGTIYRFAPDGTRNIYTVGLDGPEGLVFDGAGNLFVSETGTGVIQRFATDGTQTTFASGLNGPASLAFDTAGNLFSADFFGGAIHRFDSGGTRTTFATGLNGPANLIFDSIGRLLEADFHSGTIFRFTSDGMKSTFAANVGNPHGLAFDSDGNLYVADFAGGTILRFTPSGERSTFAAGLSGPHGLTFDQWGNLYSADYKTGNIYRFDPAGMRTTFATGLDNPANLLFEPARPSASNLLNLSTRAFIGTQAGVLIGGFILQGPGLTTVVLRAIGPSLTAFGVEDALSDPAIQLFDSSGAPVAANDNWGNGPDAAAIQRIGLAPRDPAESVIRATLPAGTYTVAVNGVGETSGFGLVEIYDLQQATSRAANISTRGIVLAGGGNNVMVAGCIVGGSASKDLVIRALGPSLLDHGVNDALGDPFLGFFNANGDALASNNNWQENPAAGTIQGLGLAPESPLESALLVTVMPGSYTAVESPAPQDSGVGLIEIYDLSPAP